MKLVYDIGKHIGKSRITEVTSADTEDEKTRTYTLYTWYLEWLQKLFPFQISEKKLKKSQYSYLNDGIYHVICRLNKKDKHCKKRAREILEGRLKKLKNFNNNFNLYNGFTVKLIEKEDINRNYIPYDWWGLIKIE